MSRKVAFLQNLTGQDLLRKKERPRLNANRCLRRKNCSPKKPSRCSPLGQASRLTHACKTQNVERQISEQTKQIGELEEKLKQSESDINNLRRENNEQSEKIGELESEINNLRRENTELNEKLTDFERQQKEMSSRLFCVDRFTTDGDISFYTFYFCASEERHFSKVGGPAI